MQQKNYELQLNAAQRTQALDISSVRLSQAQSMAKLAYWSWDSEQDIFECSYFLAKMLNLDKMFFNLAFYLQHIHADDGDMLNLSSQNILSGKTPSSINYRLLTGQGSSIEVKQELTLNEMNNKIVF
ncbi:MAG: hypothetical protein QM479_11080 [Pseudomonadota bacterium]